MDYEISHAARALAGWLHRDQVDKQGEPYIHHVDRVAFGAAKRLGDDPEALAAAWLHDSVEDGHIGMGALKEIFGARVAELVRMLTRGSEPYKDYIAGIAAGPREVIFIKVADLEDNLNPARGPVRAKNRERYENALARLRGVL